MKKHLLLLCLSLLCLPGLVKAADPTLLFGYAPECSKQLSLAGLTAGKTRVYLAYELRGEDVAVLAGNSITAVTIRSGQGKIKNNIVDPEIFITKKLGAEPLFKQVAELQTRANRDNVITLDTPFELSGVEPLYIGYSFLAPDGGMYVPIDNYTVTDNNLLYATSETDALPAQWYAAGSDQGSLYLPITVSGTNLPARLLYVLRTQAPGIAISGTKTDCSVTVLNRGTETVTSFEVETTVGDGEAQTAAVNRGVYLRSGAWKTYTLSDITLEGEGSLAVVPTVTKVNDQPATAERSGLATSIVYEHGYDRNLVIEEATGTWCGYCPSGFVMLDYIRNTYPDRYFCIAYHNDVEMGDDSTLPFMNQYVTGLPYSITNRQLEQMPGVAVSSQRNFVDNTYKELTATPSYCKLDVEAEADNTALKVKATSTFAINVEGGHSLSFALVEDNVGPYEQENYYSGSSQLMEGWEKKASVVMHVYDDVARHLEGMPGIAGSLPEKIEKETAYTYECNLPLYKVKGDKYRVIGMIVNNATGEIVNAGEWYPGKEVSGVSEIAAESNEAAEYFNLQGIRVDNPANGVYIRRQGGKTTKVLVR